MTILQSKLQKTLNRRQFITKLSGVIASPTIIAPAYSKNLIIDGIASGDVTSNSAVIWGRTNRTARMLVEWATTPNFDNAYRTAGPLVTARSGYTGQLLIDHLPSGQEIFYRVKFGDNPANETRIGHLRTPDKNKDITFLFGGDQCGGGWGINPDWGGLRLFEVMRKANPDFLIHLGDRIYSDGPILERATTPDGKIWKNIVTPEKSLVAESVEEYRGNYSYNFIDKHYKKFCSEVPTLTTWDDHEITNNWWPGRELSRRIMYRKGYIQTDVNSLARNGRQAFFDFTPMERFQSDPDRIFRKISYGQNIDIFILDSRSYRSANSKNHQAMVGKDTSLLGKIQVNWLKSALSRSKALWKIIANPLPIAHKRKHQQPRYDKFANGDDGLPLGREHEIANILSYIKKRQIRNTVWLAADVHYSAAHHFHPDRAKFRDFEPFWEFISGPFHTRPGRGMHYDKTFGADQYYRTPRAPKGNFPPSAGYIYFGHGNINAKSGDLTLSIRDLKGHVLFEKTLSPNN